MRVSEIFKMTIIAASNAVVMVVRSNLRTVEIRWNRSSRSISGNLGTYLIIFLVEVTKKLNKLRNNRLKSFLL